MLRYNYIPGDIIQVQKQYGIQYIVHQVNCRGKMGSGVAKAIKEAYPKVYVEYIEKYNAAHTRLYEDFPLDQATMMSVSDLLLGEIQFVDIGEGKHVVNFFAQETYGYDGKRYTSYDAFWNCLHLFKQEVPKGSSVAFPAQIGCGLGGANWTIILQMIIEVLGKDYEIYIVDYNGGNENANTD